MKILTQHTLLFTSLTAISAMAAEKRAVSNILEDITSLTSAVTSLDNSVNSLQSEGIFGALGIPQEFNNIISALQKAHSDITATGPLDSADATSVLAAVETAQPVIIQTLNDIVAQKSEVEKLNSEIPGITQIADSGLINVDGNTTAVENALISVLPVSLQPAASIISSSIGAAFQTAIAAYAT